MGDICHDGIKAKRKSILVSSELVQEVGAGGFSPRFSVKMPCSIVNSAMATGETGKFDFYL